MKTGEPLTLKKNDSPIESFSVINSTVLNPILAPSVSAFVPSTESSPASLYKVGFPRPLGHQRSGLAISKSIATSLIPFLRSTSLSTFLKLLLTPPRLTFAFVSFVESISKTPFTVALSSAREVCTICMLLIFALSHACRCTGLHIPLVTNRGPQSQP